MYVCTYVVVEADAVISLNLYTSVDRDCRARGRWRTERYQDLTGIFTTESTAAG